MTFRIDRVRYEQIDREGGRGWHWRIKGVRGLGVYGSIVTDAQGRGAYLLAEEDMPGSPGRELRQTCIAMPEAFGVPPDASDEKAVDAFSSLLIDLGWGPRIGP